MNPDPTLSDKLLQLLDAHAKQGSESMAKLLQTATQTNVAYGYVRVSTVKQVKEGHSIEAQTLKIQQYCRENKLPDPIIMADNGFSGKDIATRDKFNEMVKLAKKGDAIVSYSLSRLGRDALQILQFISAMENRGVKVIVLDKNLDLTTAQGRLMLTIMSGFNQFEREQIAERTSAVMQSMKEQGKLKTKGRFGYKAIGNKLIEVPEEIKVINYIILALYEHPELKNADITRMVQAQVTLGELSMRKDAKRDGKIVYQSTITSIIKNNQLRELAALKREQKQREDVLKMTTSNSASNDSK